MSEESKLAPRKWAKEIKAWADGNTVQFKLPYTNSEWRDIEDTAAFFKVLSLPDSNIEFRIKPEPAKPREFWLIHSGDYHPNFVRNSKRDAESLAMQLAGGKWRILHVREVLQVESID